MHIADTRQVSDSVNCCVWRDSDWYVASCQRMLQHRLALLLTTLPKLLIVFTGPIGHYFYHGMDKVVTRYFKIGTFGFVVAKVLGDELLFGPIHVGGYFAWMTLAEGGSWQVIELEFMRSGSLFALLQKQSFGSSTNDICRCLVWMSISWCM